MGSGATGEGRQLRIDSRQYDAEAARLAAHMESGPYNVLYERPATRALIGEVTGLDVLDVACGAGSMTRELLDAGAHVTGCDASAGMLAIARERVGSEAALHTQDCNDPFTWAADHSFDLIVMSLAYHYVRDAVGFLREMHRVLRPAGAMVISTHHPTDDWRRLDGSYFTDDVNTDYWLQGELAVTSRRMPLSTMTAHFDKADFVIDRLIEPRPSDEMQEVDPRAFGKLEDCPAFILFRLIKRPA